MLKPCFIMLLVGILFSIIIAEMMGLVLLEGLLELLIFFNAEKTKVGSPHNFKLNLNISST